MNIKKTVSVAAAAAALAFTAIPANAFLGFGGSNIAKETTQIASWIAQYAQMVQEYNQLVEEYRSLNGIRGMASLVNNPQLRRYLPDEYKNILSQGYGDWQALRTALDNPVGSSNLQKLRRDQLAIDEAMALESYKQASRRFGDIQVLLDKINDASIPDAKDMVDLQARIQAEQVMMQNEASKIFSFVCNKDFKEINLLNAKSNKKLEIMMFLFWKMEEKNNKKTKNKNNA